MENHSSPIARANVCVDLENVHVPYNSVDQGLFLQVARESDRNVLKAASPTELYYLTEICLGGIDVTRL